MNENTYTSIVRINLMNEEGYTPYCGNPTPSHSVFGCINPRTIFNGEQFVCPNCDWTSKFPIDFINAYKAKWNIK